MRVRPVPQRLNAHPPGATALASRSASSPAAHLVRWNQHRGNVSRSQMSRGQGTVQPCANAVRHQPGPKCQGPSRSGIPTFSRWRAGFFLKLWPLRCR
jgi:hypothetical protein